LSFHTIPHPGELGYETWPKDAYQNKYVGGTNNLAVDQKRGILYVPTGSAAFDFYGGNRKGKNLFANCLLALDAKTGKRIWHYQLIHHDMWDRDLPSPPNLMTIRQNNKTVDVFVQTTKHGYVFIFDRVTSKPIYPIYEVSCPNLIRGFLNAIGAREGRFLPALQGHSSPMISESVPQDHTLTFGSET